MNKKYQVLRCGRLYDGVTQEWKSSQSILVEDHLIVEVGSNVSVPEGANVIDLTDCQVTPGMIDAHMHMRRYTPRARRPRHWPLRVARKKRCAGALPPYATLAVSPATDMAFWM